MIDPSAIINAFNIEEGQSLRTTESKDSEKGNLRDSQRKSDRNSYISNILRASHNQVKSIFAEKTTKESEQLQLLRDIKSMLDKQSKRNSKSKSKHREDE